MKKIITLVVIALNIIANSIVFADETNSSEKVQKEVRYNTKFVVSAYYSPLPDQSIYFRGNFEADKRLNWDWVYAANGKKVFPWLLAAPKTYAFWTKIDLAWLWIWTVWDRWWAIVKAWVRENPYDRIDIWVGSGEEWLKKALTFWMRIVSWRILKTNDVSQNKNISLDVFKIWAYDFSKYKTENSIFLTAIWENSSPETIKKLQEILKKLNKYNWEINWKYSDELENAIYSFQLENNIVKNKEEAWAWYMWPKTREVMKKVYLSSGNNNNTTKPATKITQTKTQSTTTKTINKKVETKTEIDKVLGSLGKKK